MDLDLYQQWTRTTAIYPGAMEGGIEERAYLTLGLNSEAGELAGLVKKEMRDGVAAESEYKEKMKGEAGDVLWYLGRITDSIGITMSELAQYNHDKLEDRKRRNKIGGSGDNR